MFKLVGYLQSLSPQQHRIQPARLVAAMLAVSVVSPFTQAALVGQADQDVLPQRLTQSINQPAHRFHQDHVLGTSLDVILVGVSETEAARLFVVMQAEIDRLDQVLSIWRDDSEIAQLNQQPVFQASADLFAVIAACEQWQTQTCGAFNARLGSLLQQWQAAQQMTTLAPRTDWQQFAAQLETAAVRLNTEQRTIDRPTQVQFAPDGLAKGYVIDRVMAVALAENSTLNGLLVDIGGDLRVWGQSPRATGWQVGLRQAGTRADNAQAGAVLHLDDQAVALSGRGARDVQGADGTAHSHLFSPLTGLPADAVEQAVVVAPSTADADALATALAVLPAAQGLALIESLVGFEAQVSMRDGQQWQSSGWQNLLSTTQPMPMQTISSAAAPVSSSGWPSGFQAVLELEIPKITVSDYRAPYVVVWITDAQKQLVRSLHIWGDAKKWMDTNYVWWRRYGRKMDVDSTAKPSRKPGQYRVVWDGKNDAGQQMPAGEYTVHVEAAREHGDHSYQSFPLKAEPKSSVQQRPAEKELGNLTLRFDRVI